MQHGKQYIEKAVHFFRGVLVERAEQFEVTQLEISEKQTAN